MRNQVDTRYSGAEWFDQEERIIVGGAGGVGRGLIEELCKLNHDVTVYDFDKVDIENCTTQGYSIKDVGLYKVEALRNSLKDNFDKLLTTINAPYDVEDYCPIMIAAFDNMTARKQMFNSWKQQDDRELFIDCRMLAEQFQVFFVTPDKEEEYEKTLFEDSDVEEATCTYKQTGFISKLLHGFVTSVFTNYLVNKKLEMEARIVPFYSEFLSPINMLSHELNLEEYEQVSEEYSDTLTISE